MRGALCHGAITVKQSVNHKAFSFIQLVLDLLTKYNNQCNGKYPLVFSHSKTAVCLISLLYCVVIAVMIRNKFGISLLL